MEDIKDKLKITIIGGGYVGMSLGALLSKTHHITILDINSDVVDKINARISPIQDEGVETYFLDKNINISANLMPKDALLQAQIVIIATPTNYDHIVNEFDTSSVESSIHDALEYAPNSLLVIKSTVPVGFTYRIQIKYPKANIIFSPEFLQEGQALQDNLFPSRIIIGGREDQGKVFATILEDCSSADTVPILYMDSSSAEAVKLFSNTYLAMRVAFFNELDSFALTKKLDVKNIIKGVSMDDRIGDFYNNPSFGYGGYCLPKDTQQLLSSFDQTPQELIQAIITANQTRKLFITSQILALNPEVVGIYKLSMKAGSDNFRSSAILDIISELVRRNIKVIIFEPTITIESFLECTVINDLSVFIERSSLIIANRLEKPILGAAHKVFTRDIFGKN